MKGFTPLNFSAFTDLIERLPPRLRLAGRSIGLHLLCHARRKTGTIGGVTLKRGQVLYAERTLADRCNVSYQTARTVLKRFETVGFLTHESTRPAHVSSIIDFDSYVLDGVKSNAGSNAQETHKKRSTDAVPNDKRKMKKYSPSKEASKALDIWLRHAPLPQSTKPEDCLKVLDDLHRLDRVPWEGPQGIEAICDYAARVWVAKGFIGSPLPLRKWTQAKDMKKYEKMQQQMTADRSSASPGSRPPADLFQIAYATGLPIKEPQRRLEAICEKGLSSDPDVGHPWTLSDEEIAAQNDKGRV